MKLRIMVIIFFCSLGVENTTHTMGAATASNARPAGRISSPAKAQVSAAGSTVAQTVKNAWNQTVKTVQNGIDYLTGTTRQGNVITVKNLNGTTTTYRPLEDGTTMRTVASADGTKKTEIVTDQKGKVTAVKNIKNDVTTSVKIVDPDTDTVEHRRYNDNGSESFESLVFTRKGQAPTFDATIRTSNLSETSNIQYNSRAAYNRAKNISTKQEVTSFIDGILQSMDLLPTKEYLKVKAQFLANWRPNLTSLQFSTLWRPLANFFTRQQPNSSTLQSDLDFDSTLDNPDEASSSSSSSGRTLSNSSTLDLRRQTSAVEQDVDSSSQSSESIDVDNLSGQQEKTLDQLTTAQAQSRPVQPQAPSAKFKITTRPNMSRTGHDQYLFPEYQDYLIESDPDLFIQRLSNKSNQHQYLDKVDLLYKTLLEVDPDTRADNNQQIQTVRGSYEQRMDSILQRNNSPAEKAQALRSLMQKIKAEFKAEQAEVVGQPAPAQVLNRSLSSRAQALPRQANTVAQDVDSLSLSSEVSGKAASKSTTPEAYKIIDRRPKARFNGDDLTPDYQQYLSDLPSEILIDELAKVQWTKQNTPNLTKIGQIRIDLLYQKLLNENPKKQAAIIRFMQDLSQEQIDTLDAILRNTSTPQGKAEQIRNMLNDAAAQFASRRYSTLSNADYSSDVLHSVVAQPSTQADQIAKQIQEKYNLRLKIMGEMDKTKPTAANIKKLNELRKHYMELSDEINKLVVLKNRQTPV